MVASIFATQQPAFQLTPAQALIARMTTPPSGARAAAITTAVESLVSAGIWDKLDVLYVMAAADSQAARLNWKSSSYTLTAINAPTFTADKGYLSDGASSYLTTGYDVTAAGLTYLQNSCCVGVWCDTNITGNSFYDTGMARNRTNSRSSSNFIAANLQSTGSTSSTILPSLTSVGHSVWSRTAATVSRFFKDGTQLTPDTTSGSIPLLNTQAFVCAYSNAGTPASYSTRRINAVHYGAGLSIAEVATLNSTLQTYMTAVGV